MDKNKFYIARKNHDIASIFAGYSWASGQWEPTSDITMWGMSEISVKDLDFIKTDKQYDNVVTATYYWFDSRMRIIRKDEDMKQAFEIQVPAGAHYFAMDVKFSRDMSDILYDWSDFYVYMYKRVTPHYKSLTKQWKRESGQMFFRESLDGTISLFGKDFELVNSFSIYDTLVFDVYEDNSLVITTEFNKTDCTFDRVRKSVQLKLKSNDKYTNFMSKYKNSYDLIKLATATSNLTLTKRCIVQVYVQGEKVVSNYSGGTYWDTEVQNPVDSADALQNKYYFYPGPMFKEVSLSGFNYDINSVYICSNANVWNGISYADVGGQTYKIPCSIKFIKVYSAYETVQSGDLGRVLRLSDGTTSGVIGDSEGDTETVLYDTYSIEIYDNVNGTGTKLYESEYLYGNDSGFMLAQGNSLYPMYAIHMPSPLKQPSPDKFNLGASVVEYKTWLRELCDVEEAADGTPTYDLPYDDFATERSNYKKCIGLSGVGDKDSVVRIVQNEASSKAPTAYGRNDYGLYFNSPYAGSVSAQHGYFPLARNTWGNTSLWIYFDNANPGSFEQWCSKVYKKYTTKDNYHIADVIKSLLHAIDPTIKHEATPEYSQFLYGNSSVVSSASLGGCQLYMTQKTNILKGEYDQAAQKAEISLETVMAMLRDCFQCYWYIDKDNRFIVEHVYYFLHGNSYNSAGEIGLDLTMPIDRFNKKPILYCQQELKYQTSNLKSRIEFSWMDDVTDSMGNLAINFTGAYISDSSSESVNVSEFCSDIDYMLFKPDDFSNDGFALIMAKDGIVPIVNTTIRDPKQFSAPLDLYTQNGMLSWRQLVYHRMYNAPSTNISLDSGEGPIQWQVVNTERIMQHDISFVAPTDLVNANMLVKTPVGNGYIDTASMDIDTHKTDLTLLYEPI